MTKYSDEFKLKIVNEYLEGNLGFILLAEKYGIPSKSQIQCWVHNYKTFGKKGLRKIRSKQVYSVKFKLDVLNFMKQTGASYRDTATEFNMTNLSLIANWSRKFLDKGVAGLCEKVKGRPPMSINPKNKPTNQDALLSREEQLEREVELLRLEVAYLKKLKAFQENPDAFLAKHKQQWHSNSNKKDSD